VARLINFLKRNLLELYFITVILFNFLKHLFNNLSNQQNLPKNFFFKKKNLFYQAYHFNSLNLNSIYKTNFLTFLIFKFFNKSNFILNKKNFFIFLIDQRMYFSIKGTYYYKHITRFNFKQTKDVKYANFLIGFRSF